MSRRTYLGEPSPNVKRWMGGEDGPVEHAETWYKYAGNPDWNVVNIEGPIEGLDEYTPTDQIPNVQEVVEIEVGTNVTCISNAFIDCYSLLKLTIPSSVVGIYGSAFKGCYDLMCDEGVIVFTGKTLEQAKALMNNSGLIGDSGSGGYMLKCQCGSSHFICAWDSEGAYAIIDID